MSDFIHLLPDSVANQIAAGEVIQRPASVVKELVENAVDAGARNISILLTDAGRTCIQVIDDGCGMSETDARMAFERHATSKITQANDLFALSTFGFRGEALPSIAAVAQVELHTKMEQDELGTALFIEGSKVLRQEADMCPTGSNFMIKNIFFNVPARRKFLKSDQTELSNSINEVERIALVHPDICFRVLHNGVEIINLPTATLRQRVIHVFDKKLNDSLLSLEVETSIANISGFIGTPESARKKGSHQFFFVNGRYMRHPYFHKAIMEAFAGLIPEGEQVSYFVYFNVDPSRIDVNIHPTKTEIKFEDEHAIWQILVATIREVLGRSHSVPSIDFDTADKPDIPLINDKTRFSPPQPHYDPTYNPFNSRSENSYRKPQIDWEKLYGLEPKRSEEGKENGGLPFGDEAIPSEKSEDISSNQSTSAGMNLIKCYQYNGSYIITSVDSGLMIIEQHRAHVRILYERYMHQLESHKGVAQGLLFPEIIQVSPADAVQLEHMSDDFASLGFELNNLGGGSFSLQGIPSGIEGLDPCKLVQEMLSSAIEKSVGVKSDRHHQLALTMARRSAIVEGQLLSEEEMSNIATNLFACSIPNYTPDGKKIVCIVDEKEISKMFD